MSEVSLYRGPNLRYAGLAAYDSTGKTLQARLVLQAEQVLIRVGDTKAKYPLVIDLLSLADHPSELGGEKPALIPSPI